MKKILAMIFTLFLLYSSALPAKEINFPTELISSNDALLIAESDEILCKKNENKGCVPASTLKVLTALASIHYLGRDYRFETQFFQDKEGFLKVKGLGDPMLLSEVFQVIADELAIKLKNCKGLIIDDTYFSDNLEIPGSSGTTNPYDATNGAFCANFNTVFFKRNKQGRILSAEPQTPMVDFAVEKIEFLGLKSGRYTFIHHSHDAAIYAGEILHYFLKEKGVDCPGKIRMGSVVESQDRLIYTYTSVFTLDDILRKMLKYSNNYMANQLLLYLGAKEYGAPGSIEKGVKLLSHYTKEVLHLNDIQIAEGSGLSRENRISALDMLKVLKAFEPHRDLLNREGDMLYKTGTLSDVRARVGYIERESGNPYYFIIFMNGIGVNIKSVVNGVVESLKTQM